MVFDMVVGFVARQRILDTNPNFKSQEGLPADGFAAPLARYAGGLGTTKHCSVLRVPSVLQKQQVMGRRSKL